jgi:TFIIH basal transcription factor complex TTD-A subunit
MTSVSSFGELDCSDSAVKQILLNMNEKETAGFIVEDLDDFHLLIKAEHEFRVRRELEAEVYFRARFFLQAYALHLFLA